MSILGKMGKGDVRDRMSLCWVTNGCRPYSARLFKKFDSSEDNE